MLGALIKQGSDVVDKQVFGGDDEASQALIEDYQEAHPDLTIEIHRDSDPDWPEAFDQIQITPKQTTAQTAWLTAKGSGAISALMFIAKYLGLE